MNTIMVGVCGTSRVSVALDALLGLKVVVSDVRKFSSSLCTKLDVGRLDLELSLILPIILLSPLPNSKVSVL